MIQIRIQIQIQIQIQIHIIIQIRIQIKVPTQINTFHRVLPQKHRGIVRNLELIHEELDERQLPDKSKQEEEEERRKKRKKKERGDKMSKLNHKNGNHGDGKLEEQGLIDPNENKIGEEEYLFCKESKDL